VSYKILCDVRVVNFQRPSHFIDDVGLVKSTQIASVNVKNDVHAWLVKDK